LEEEEEEEEEEHDDINEICLITLQFNIYLHTLISYAHSVMNTAF